MKKRAVSSLIAVIMAALMLAPAENAAAKCVYKEYMKKLDGKVRVSYVNGYNRRNFKRIGSGDSSRIFWKNNWKARKKKISLKQFKYYRITDIGGDKKPELLLSKTEYAQGDGHVLICKYIKGKVRPLFCAYGLRLGMFKAKKRKIAFSFGGSSFTSLVFTKLSGARLKHLSVYTRWVVKDQTPYYTAFYRGYKRIGYDKFKKVTDAMSGVMKFKPISKCNCE